MRCEFLSQDDTEGFIAANDNIIVIVFRGTQPSHYKDIVADAKVCKVPSPMGEVHSGFQDAFNLVKDDMFYDIRQLRDQDQSIWVTGHSLGAALAAIAVIYLLDDNQPVNGLYNYGQPRVGSNEFAEEFNRSFHGRHF